MITRVVQRSPRELAQAVVARAIDPIHRRVRRHRDRAQGTFPRRAVKGHLFHYWPRPTSDWITPDQRELLSALCDHYLAHRFDLLGSGWIKVSHGMHCRGLEGHRYASGPALRAEPNDKSPVEQINAANRERALSVWRLIDADYEPIDWHLDFKTGHRWSATTWYLDTKIGHLPGVDVKVPWELARMQHLPQMALAYALGQSQPDQTARANLLAREFRNQVLDFIATNPPRFGVNWRCTMDVAVRVANWLCAYDCFRAADARWDTAFEEQFLHGIYAHGLHIVHHLEWRRHFRGNHYLADVVGLLFVAAYLPRSREVDAWLAFAVRQLVTEVEQQFTPDGANVEASTSYHRLAAEMVIFATALVLALGPEKKEALLRYDHRVIRSAPGLEPAPIAMCPLPGRQETSPFPDWYWTRLEKMAEFSIHVTKPTGRIHQVGDNDSGRFFKLHPDYFRRRVADARLLYANLADYRELCDDAIYWDEDHLDHRGLVAAISALFDRADMQDACGTGRIETLLIRQWCGGTTVSSYLTENRSSSAAGTRIGCRDDWPVIMSEINSNRRMQRHHYEIGLPGADFLKGTTCCGYPDFGLFVFRSPRLYLAVRCGPVGDLGRGAHAHNDQLSIELNVDGKDLIVDPGTYLYTADVRWRNAYRSVKAHFAPQRDGGMEPGCLKRGIFRLDDRAQAECLFFAPHRFVGRHFGFGLPVYRVVELTPEAVHVSDYADRRVRLKPLSPIRSLSAGEPAVPLSLGYGIRVA